MPTVLEQLRNLLFLITIGLAFVLIKYFYNKSFVDDFSFLFYELLTIEIFITDLEVKYLNLENIFKDNNKKIGKDVDCNYEIYSKGYFLFDNENNVNKKELFYVNFVEKKSYEKLLRYKAKNNINNKGDEKIKFDCIISLLNYHEYNI